VSRPLPGYSRFGNTARCLSCERTDFVSNFTREGCACGAAPMPVEHRLGDGTVVVEGLRVLDYDHEYGTVTKVSDKGPCDPPPFGVCGGWHTVRKDRGGTMIFNCARLVRLVEVTL